MTHDLQKHWRPGRRSFVALGAAALAGTALTRASAWQPHSDTPDDVFREAGVTGGFALLALADNRETFVNRDMAQAARLPASTFKIPNTLIGLETGVIPDKHFSLPWDGTRRSREVWNRDQNLTGAMHNSTVWFYQEVARRVGAARMQEWLDRLDYGNHDSGGGIDLFWLSGALRISPRQQAAFLARLVRGGLPVKPVNAQIVQKILPSATVDGVTLRWKGGLTSLTGENIGWVVGMVERGGRSTHTFANLVVTTETADKDMAAALKERLTTGMRLLKAFGVVPPGMTEPV